MAPPSDSKDSQQVTSRRPIGREEAPHSQNLFQHSAPQHRGLDTRTPYAEDTDVMEVTYSRPRSSHHDPLYTATSLAPALDSMTAASAPQPASLPQTPTTPSAESETETETDPSLPDNPFHLPPPSHTLWLRARAALSTDRNYFYEMMRLHERDLSRCKRRPAPEECFAVRNLERTLEIEQGLADLRGRLRLFLAVGDEGGLMGLRDSLRGLVGEGMEEEGKRE